MTATGNQGTSAVAPNPSLYTKEIQDLYVRKNFQNLVSYFASQNQLTGFKFFELSISAAVVGATLAHGLGYIPKDVVISQITGSGTVQFLYGSFTSANVVYTATGPCRVRFFVGTYFADTSTVAAKATDIQTAVPQPFGALGPTSGGGKYTATGNERVISMTANGVGTGALTLPPVASAAGLDFWVQKTDNNFTQVVINVSSADSRALIQPDGVNSTALSVQFERVHLYCDGTNWYVLTRDYPRNWTAFTMAVTGATYNPSFGTTQTVNQAFWRKSGDSIEIRFEYAHTVKGSTGSGIYLFALPKIASTGGQLQINSNKVNTSSSVSGGLQALGAAVAYDGTTQYAGAAIASGVNTLSIATTGGLVGSSLAPLGNATTRYGFYATVPILGWKG